MSTVHAQITTLAHDMADLCSNISVRQDENGPFILAFGLENIHSLELRKVKDEFELELWHGATAEVEYVEDTLRFEQAGDALACARSWLRKDAGKGAAGD